MLYTLATLRKGVLWNLQPKVLFFSGVFYHKLSHWHTFSFHLTVAAPGWVWSPKTEPLGVTGAGFYRADPTALKHWRDLEALTSAGENRSLTGIILSWFTSWLLKTLYAVSSVPLSKNIWSDSFSALTLVIRYNTIQYNIKTCNAPYVTRMLIVGADLELPPFCHSFILNHGFILKASQNLSVSV